MENMNLNLDYILDDSDDLFADSIAESQDEELEESSKEQLEESNEEKKENKKEKQSSTEAEEPESVGEDNEEEEAPDAEEQPSSPNDFFSSIAGALAEEGILPNLDEDAAKNIKTPEDLRSAIEDQIRSELDEQQRRVAEALDNKVEPNVIRQYENIIARLDGISEEDLKAEGEQAESFRKQILYQDYINRGFSKNRAEKEVNKSVQSGDDIDDSLEALESIKSFYKKNYNKLLEEAKQERLKEEKAEKKRQEEFKKNLFDEKTKFFGDLSLDANTRKRVFENIAKPVYKDPKTGQYSTALQKFSDEHPEEFLTAVGVLYTLTDGFKSLTKLTDKKVKKEMKKGLRDLENRINNSSISPDGNLRFVSGVNDEESYLGRGLRLDI